jgi:hypothetical protein
MRENTFSKLFKIMPLFPLLGGNSYADTLTVEAKCLDAALQYNVKDTARSLEAELVFPAEALVGAIGYDYPLSVGSVSVLVQHSLVSKNATGTDSDWQNGEMTVYSESVTTLNRFYSLNLAYTLPFLEHGSAGIELFHEYWKLTWSDTEQQSYYNDSYDEFSGSTVRYTQQLDGTRVHLSYEDTLHNIPWEASAGMEIAWHESKDEHLLRSFYTLSNDWMFGYFLALRIEIWHAATSSLSLKTLYKRIEGDADMAFYHESGGKFMTLPATFQTTEKSLGLQYFFRF